MNDAQKTKREKIVKSMKKNFSDFKKRYGDRAKEVMYATATKQAMKEEKSLKDEDKEAEQAKNKKDKEQSKAAEDRFMKWAKAEPKQERK